MSFETVLQQAIYTKVSTDIATPVYDDVPQQADFPYVTIGEDSFTAWDTDSELGATSVLTVHTWSRTRGKKETKAIQGDIYDSLHRATLISAGYNFVTIDLISSESFLDADGLTRHGVQTFNAIIERL